MNPKLILLIAGIFMMVLAVKTVIPNPKASKPCRLGYKASCSFTPWSTLILVALGTAVFIVRVRI